MFYKLALALFLLFISISVISTHALAEAKPSCDILDSLGGVNNWQKLDPECDWDARQVYDVYQNKSNGEYFRCNYQTQQGQCSAPVENSPDCQDSRESYGQCGGTVGLEEENKYLTFEITRVTDCKGNIRYENKSLGLGRECDIRQAMTVSPTATAVPDNTFCSEQKINAYGQCGGTTGLEEKDPSELFEVNVYRNCKGEVRYDPVPLGESSDCSQPISPSAEPTQSKSIVKISINSQDIYPEDFVSGKRIHLDGLVGVKSEISTPISVSYTDGTTRYLNINFNYIGEVRNPFDSIATIAPNDEVVPVTTIISQPSPTDIPTVGPAQVTSIFIAGNEHLVNQGLLSVKYQLPWGPDSQEMVVVPVRVLYSDGTSRYLAYNFTFSPKARPSFSPAVILDPGHGNPDLDPWERKSDEGALNLLVARTAKQYLSEEGVTAYLTHDGNLGINDHYGDLKQRVSIINQLADRNSASLFVAIHFDASSSYSFQRGPASFYNETRTFTSDNKRLGIAVSSGISNRTNTSTFGRIGEGVLMLDTTTCCGSGPLFILGKAGVSSNGQYQKESYIDPATKIPGILSEYFSKGMSYNDIRNNNSLVNQISKGYCDGILMYLDNRTCK